MNTLLLENFFNGRERHHAGAEYVQHLKKGLFVPRLSTQQINTLIAEDLYYQKVAYFFAQLATQVSLEIECEGTELQATIKALIDEWLIQFSSAQALADAHGSWQILIESTDVHPNAELTTPQKEISLTVSPKRLSRVSADGYSVNEVTLSETTKEASLIHTTKVLDFSSRTQGNSVIQQFHKYWALYWTALTRLTGLLTRKDFITMQREGYQEELLESEDPDQLTTNILEGGVNAIESEGLMLVDSRTNLNVHSRDLGSVDLICRQLRGAALGASGLSEQTLFGYRDRSGNLTSSDRNDRREMGLIADRIFKLFWLPKISYLLKILGYGDSVKIRAGTSNQPTQEEQIELIRRHAEADKLYLDMGVLTREEIRTRFINGWSPELILDASSPLNTLEKTRNATANNIEAEDPNKAVSIEPTLEV